MMSLLAVASMTACTSTAPAPPAQSITTGADARIDALIARMTLEEKVGQLSLYAAAGSGDDPNPDARKQSREQQLAEIRAGRVTGLFNGVGARWTRELQRVAVEESRLKIPLIFGADVIHGFRTVFPVPLAEAASWEPALAQRSARVAAIEATAAGIQWNFAPMVDVSRDARWGRAVEGAGEDVYLGRQFAAARVRGFQDGDPAVADSMAATLKHFAAYGAAEAGLDYNTVDISERSLRETYLPPFKAGFDAGAAVVMTAFNEIAGVPSSANPELLDGILRRDWGFKGPVVSDYMSEAELVAHGFAADEREATWLAFLAGVDISMQSGIYMKYLPDLVRKGAVPEARVDQAVRRVLKLKQRLGLFDDPYRYADEAREAARTATPKHRALAREAARRSIVLLRNQHELLPLPKTGKRLALIGPFAGQSDINGPWTLFANDASSVSLEQGLRSALGDSSLLSVVRGSEVDRAIDGGIDAAVAAARKADVVLLAIGESARLSGEAKSRAEIVIPAAQQALAEAVAATGKPVVVLLRNGRPLALRGAVRLADAILVTWFLGSESGNAIADVLFGDYSPSARLPMSFPQEPGQVPYYYARKNTGRAAPPDSAGEYQTRFLDLSNEAAYPFGYGLSYSQFSYSAPELERVRLEWDGSLTVRTRITNTGPREAEEVVQLYVRDRVASVTRPVRELKGFEKVRLAPGQSVQVSFTLRRADLEFIGRELKPVAEPGVFDLWVASNATGGSPRSFELMPP